MRHKRDSNSLASCAVAAVVISLLCSGYAFGAQPLHARNADVLSYDASRLTLVAESDHRKAQKTNGCTGCSHDERIIKRWSLKHFPASYAGMYFVAGKAVQLVIGYTERQLNRVRAVKRLPGLIAPQRVSEFSFVPENSLRELNDLQQQILNDVMRDDAYSGVIISVGVVIKTNKVDVGTKNVRRARKVLRELYGPQAPIQVRHEEAPVGVE